jgi:hypothetical protein
MRKSRAREEIVRLNQAAFRLNPREIRTGNLEALVDAALARVLGGEEVQSCVQYTCNLYAPG